MPKLKNHSEIRPFISRRRLLHIIAVAGATGICARFADSSMVPFFSGFHVIRRSQPMMGTLLNLVVGGPDRDSAEAAVDKTIRRMLDLEQTLSRHRPDSEISRLNRSGTLQTPSPDLLLVLRRAQEISEKAKGAFDVTILPLLTLQQQNPGEPFTPDQEAIGRAQSLVDYHNLHITDHSVTLTKTGMGITLDGIGKGYIVDQGADTLSKSGFTNIFVEAGGDLMTRGTNPQGKPWTIGIRNPRPNMARKLITIKTGDLAVATSGDYMQAYTPDLRHHHIINPNTGFSPSELASCTVTAPDTALADALATAAMVLGPNRALALLESMPECEGVLIAKDLSTMQTSGFAALT